jgi:hypothetical protein
MLLTACAPERPATLETQLRDRLTAKYGSDYELVALEESTDAGSRAVCAVVRLPLGPGDMPPRPHAMVVLTVEGNFFAGGVVNSAFLQEWTKYCGSRFFYLVTPIP